MNSRKNAGLNQILLLAVLLVIAARSSVLAQTVSDSNQNQTWGVWKTPNPQTPGIQFRAKCDSDNDATGRMVSEWSYQFRSSYKGTMDIVYLTEGGIAQPPVNKMLGPFLDTLKPGEIFSNGAQLYGSCGQHSGPKAGLHMTLKCAVPTGQDAPCFKDSDGNQYPQAKASGSQIGDAQSGVVTSRKTASASKQTRLVGVVWVCDVKASTDWNDGSREPNPTTAIWFTFQSDGTVIGSAMLDTSSKSITDITPDVITGRKEYPLGQWEQKGNAVNWTDRNEDFTISGVLNGNSINAQISTDNLLKQKLTRSGTITCTSGKFAQ
jgi:hypothetical protein